MEETEKLWGTFGFATGFHEDRRLVKHSHLMAVNEDYFKEAEIAQKKGKPEEAKEWFSLAIDAEIEAEMPS